jgi:putative endonuclease
MERMLGLQLLEGFVHASDRLAVHLGKRLPAHLELGERGEEAAFFYLRRRGYTVVARGWRSAKARGDLDLVAWEGSTLCFLEIKTRSSRTVATAESAVDPDKMQTLRRLARQYMLALSDPPEQIRFDVLSIYFHSGRPTDFELFRGAFGWR